MSAHELFRDSLGYPQNISSVVIAVPNERFTAKLAFSRPIPEARCDLFLQIHVQYVGAASGRVMKVCAQAQKKIVSPLNSTLVAFTQPVFPDQLVCAE